jgi:hypothetical protein
MSEEETELPRKRKQKERVGSFDAHMHKQFYGDEPTWTGVKTTDEGYKLKMIHALSWATSCFDHSYI